MAAGIRFKAKRYLLTTKDMCVHEMNCWVMDAVIPLLNLFNIAAIRAMRMKGAALYMKNASVAV